MVRALMLVENRSRSPRLVSSWGLSIWIEVKGKRILFDVGPDYPTLAYNARELGVDLSTVNAIFISHWHSDHSGALIPLLNNLPKPVPVYTPSYRGVPSEVVCRRGHSIADIGLSTGPLGYGALEHSLVIPLDHESIAVFVGCSHPGIDEILSVALDITKASRISLVMGGLHIGRFEAEYVAKTFKAFRVERVVPAHCTSDDAIEYLVQELKGEIEVIEPYVGLRIEV